MNERSHWDAIFERKHSGELSWYQPHLDRSLELVRASGIGRDAAIIDIGAGVSTFVDDLLDRGHTDVTVLDVSEAALSKTRDRLGERASRVHWITGDVTRVALPAQRYDFWHDRAVFHFLADAEARRRYVDAALRSLRPGGHIVVATFGVGGPAKCSGLEVVRYNEESLHDEFGAAFRKIAAFDEIHKTPWGSEQEFVYCYCRVSS